MSIDRTILKAAQTLDGCVLDIKEGNINFDTGIELVEWVCEQYRLEYGHVPKQWAQYLEYLKQEEEV